MCKLHWTQTFHFLSPLWCCPVHLTRDMWQCHHFKRINKQHWNSSQRHPDEFKLKGNSSKYNKTVQTTKQCIYSFVVAQIQLTRREWQILFIKHINEKSMKLLSAVRRDCHTLVQNVVLNGIKVQIRKKRLKTSQNSIQFMTVLFYIHL